MPCVKCHMSNFIIFNFKVVKIASRETVFNGAYPVYFQGRSVVSELPRTNSTIVYGTALAKKKYKKKYRFKATLIRSTLLEVKCDKYDNVSTTYLDLQSTNREIMFTSMKLARNCMMGVRRRRRKKGKKKGFNCLKCTTAKCSCFKFIYVPL